MKKVLQALALILCAAALLTGTASAKYIADGAVTYTAADDLEYPYSTTFIYSKVIQVCGGRIPYTDRTIGDQLQMLEVYEGVNEGWYFVWMKGGSGGFARDRDGKAGNGGIGGTVKGYIYLKPGQYCLSVGSNGFNSTNDGDIAANYESESEKHYTKKAYTRGGSGGAGRSRGGGGGGATTIHYTGPLHGVWDGNSELNANNVIAVASGGGGGPTSSNSSYCHGGNGGQLIKLGVKGCVHTTSGGIEVPGQTGYFAVGSRGHGSTASPEYFATGNGDVGNGGNGNTNEGGEKGASTTGKYGFDGSFMKGGNASDTSWSGGGGAGFFGGGGGSQFSGNGYGDGAGGAGSSFLRDDANYKSFLEDGLTGPSADAIKAYCDDVVERHRGNLNFNNLNNNYGTASCLDYQPQIIMVYLGPDDINSETYDFA